MFSNSMELPDAFEMQLGKLEEFAYEAYDEIKLKVLKGKVEYFGNEYSDCTVLYNLKERGSLFTWKGSTFRIHGKVKEYHKNKNTVMTLHANLHVALNTLRTNAKKTKTKGPIIMVAGPSDAGKSSLCRILLNYAVQTHWTPLFVDVDVGQNEIAMPATIGATKVIASSLPDTLPQPDLTSVYAFGHITPSNNLAHYHHLISKLAKLVFKKMKTDDLCHSSGVLINTCGWVTDAGYRALLHTAQAFNVDKIVVLGDAELSSLLSDHFSCILLPSSSSVVKRTREERIHKRERRLYKYLFENNHKSSLSNHNNSDSDLSSFSSFVNNQIISTGQIQFGQNDLNAAVNETSQPISFSDAAKSIASFKLNPLAQTFEPGAKQSCSFKSNLLPTFIGFNKPQVYEVDLKSIKVYMLNDSYSHEKNCKKLVPIQLNTGHARMVLSLSASPGHILNEPLLGVALILEVLKESMYIVTSCAQRPPCMLLMPSLNYPHPIPS